MRLIYRAIRATLTLVAVLALPLAGSSATASAETSPQAHAWHLENGWGTQRMCVQRGPENRIHQSYLIFAVTGKWSTDLHFGMDDLPPDWTATQSYIPPGSNHPDPDDGAITVNGWLGVGGPTSAPLGAHQARIWVSDGIITETTRAEIVITTASWVDCMQAGG